MRQVWARLAENRFVLRTDVKCQYASIDHFLLLDQPAGARRQAHPVAVDIIALALADSGLFQPARGGTCRFL